MSEETTKKPVKRYSALGGGAYYFGGYDATKNSIFRELYGDTRTRAERDMLPLPDRTLLIAWLRRAQRNDARVAGILTAYAQGIGSPTPHIVYRDDATSVKLENWLLGKFADIRYGVSEIASGLSAMMQVVIREVLIGGECFVVKMADGRLRVLPSEYCGSPLDAGDGWREHDGIIYNADGTIRAYRFGRRINGSMCYDKGASTVVPAQFVYHLGTPTRAEEVRYPPRLSAAICTLQDIADLCEFKLNQVKIQSTMPYFVTKNIAPEIASQLQASFEENPDENGEIEDWAGRMTARSGYEVVNPNKINYLETGEDIKTPDIKFNGADFDAFLLSNLDFVCASIGITVEEALVGYRRSNYSSSRASKLQWRKTVDTERQMYSRFLYSVEAWLLWLAIGAGELPEIGFDEISAIVDATTLIYPPIREIDEQKAASADISYVKAGLKSRQDVLGERGEYTEDLIKQQVADAAAMALAVKKAAEESGLTAAEIAAYLPQNSSAPFSPLNTVFDQSGDNNNG